MLHPLGRLCRVKRAKLSRRKASLTSRNRSISVQLRGRSEAVNYYAWENKLNEDNRRTVAAASCGAGVENITRAARNLGKLRAMSEDEIEANLSSLEEEVAHHLQIEHAVNLASGW